MLGKDQQLKLEDIAIKDVEKRRNPNKVYFYVTKVTWNDGAKATIARPFSAFFDLQMALLDEFPVEGGQDDPTHRIIPILRSPFHFATFNNRHDAIKRVGALVEFCSALLKLPEHILCCKTMGEFFERGNGDHKVTADSSISTPMFLDEYIAVAVYESAGKNQLSLKEGEVVEVVEKNENGWWLVKNEKELSGWVPGVYLDNLHKGKEKETADKTENRKSSGNGERYEAQASYTPSMDDEIGFEVGEVLEILEKNLEGWWYAKSDRSQGRVPATFLKKVEEGATAPPSGMNHVKAAQAAEEGAPPEITKPPPKPSTVRRTLTVEGKSQALLRQETCKQNKMPCLPEEHDEDPEKEEEEGTKDNVINSAGKYIAISAFEKEQRNEMNLEVGEIIQVVEKNVNGWWLATKEDGDAGWVPGVFLEKLYAELKKEKGKKAYKRAKPGEGELYATIAAFQKGHDNELSFGNRVMLEVLEKNKDGWWYARLGAAEGWVPATYLVKATQGEVKTEADKKAEALERWSRGINKIRRMRYFSAGGTIWTPPKKSSITNNLSAGDKDKIRNNFQQRAEVHVSSNDTEMLGDAFAIGVYKTVTDYNSKLPRSLNFKKGQIVQVYRKGNEGWLFGRIGGKRGWVPESYLKALPAKSPQPLRKNGIHSKPNLQPSAHEALQDYPWFRDIPKDQAEDLLRLNGREGFFVVRPSKRGAKQGMPYSITVFHEKTIWNFHIRIRKQDKKFAVGIHDLKEPTFTNIPDLIEFYKKNPLIIGKNDNKVLLRE